MTHEMAPLRLEATRKGDGRWGSKTQRYNHDTIVTTFSMPPAIYESEKPPRIDAAEGHGAVDRRI